MRFSFTGNFTLNGEDTKNPFVREGKTGTGKAYKTFNASICAAKNNRAYIELFGMVQDEIKTMDNNTPANKIVISWADRTDPDIVKSIAGYKKHVYKVGSDKRTEFVADYDMVNQLVDDAEILKSGKYTVTGQTQANVYQGKVTQRFVIQNVYEAGEDVKNALKLHDVFYWNKEGIDTADWADSKKITINGYISMYINKDEGNKYIPLTAILDCSKIDFNNEKHVKLLKFKLNGLGLTLDGDKVKCVFKKSTYYKQAVEFNYYNGSEEIEFDESQLTEYQKEQVALGLKELNDFRPSGSTYGNRITEYRIVGFDSKGDFENGYVEADSADEFEENIYVAPKEESEDDLDEDTKKSDAKTESDESDDDDLFG